jgi:hypothetical protein
MAASGLSNGTLPGPRRYCDAASLTAFSDSGDEEAIMHGLIYLIGLIIVIMFILSFLGLR